MDEENSLIEEKLPSYLPIEQCEHRGIYRIDSRNLSIGVFDAKKNGFIGIREKWGERYLFTEWHWDTGEPFGTVKPQEKIGVLPDEIELAETESALFNFLKKM